MKSREDIEREINDLLSADLTSTEFSNRVFGQFHGLFPRLGTTPDERKRIIGTDLWKAAQARLRELEQRDFARLRKLVPAADTVPA